MGHFLAIFGQFRWKERYLSKTSLLPIFGMNRCNSKTERYCQNYKILFLWTALIWLRWLVMITDDCWWPPMAIDDYWWLLTDDRGLFYFQKNSFFIIHWYQQMSFFYKSVIFSFFRSTRTSWNTSVRPCVRVLLIYGLIGWRWSSNEL